MPTLRRTKPDPEKIYVSVESWGAANGLSVKHGERLLGSDPRVIMHPEFFRLDGAPNDYDPLAEATVHEARQYDEYQKAHAPTAMRAADVVVAIEDINLDGDPAPADVKRHKLTRVTILAGSRLSRWSPVAMDPQIADKFRFVNSGVTEG